MDKYVKNIIEETFASKKQQRFFYAKASDKSLPKKKGINGLNGRRNILQILILKKFQKRRNPKLKRWLTKKVMFQEKKFQ